MRTREMRWVVGLLLAALALAGCADDGQTPGPDPTGAVPVETTDVPEPPTSAEPTPGMTEPAPGPSPWPEPTRPAAMERDDIEGAKAAAEYFLALYPYVFATGDLEVWAQMSHPECRFCETVTTRVRELHSEGGYGTGGSIQTEEIDAVPPDSEFAHYRVSVLGLEEPSVSHDSSGEPLDSAPGGKIYYTVGVIPDDSWVIRGIVIEEAE